MNHQGFTSSCYRLLTAIIGVMLVVGSSEAYSDVSRQFQRQLTTEASQFLQAHLLELYPSATLSIDVKPPSKGLKLEKCRLPLIFELPSRIQNRMSLRAHCENPRWKVYVSTQVSVSLPVVTAAKPLSKAQTLGANDLLLQSQDILALRGQYFVDLSSLQGQSTRRAIPRGRIIKPSHVEAAELIKKGDAVVIEALRGSVSIRSTGTALDNGKQGEQIAVKNDKSGKIVKAFVVSNGLVRTPG